MSSLGRKLKNLDDLFLEEAPAKVVPRKTARHYPGELPKKKNKNRQGHYEKVFMVIPGKHDNWKDLSMFHKSQKGVIRQNMRKHFRECHGGEKFPRYCQVKTITKIKEKLKEWNVDNPDKQIKESHFMAEYKRVCKPDLRKKFTHFAIDVDADYSREHWNNLFQDFYSSNEGGEGS